MVSNEIKKWIEEGKKKGYSDEQLKELLLKQGYSQSNINEAFNKKSFDKTTISLIILIIIAAVLGLFLYMPSSQEIINVVEVEENNQEVKFIGYPETNEISFCDNLDTKGKDDCIFAIALRTRDKDLCKNMSTPEDKLDCEFYVISSSEDKSVCEQFSTPEDKEYCRGYTPPDF